MTTEIDRTIALAGLLQSSMQVSRLARQGEWNNAAAETGIYSLFQMEADSVTAVYADCRGLRPGLLHLKKLLQSKIERADIEITRYALRLLQLQGILKDRDAMLNQIRQGLYAIQNEFDICDVNNTALQSRIADIYVNTVSTIEPKIQVEGEREYLTQSSNTWRIRTMLLCGIRSAVLWRQLGGTRWRLFLGRRRILRGIDSMIET